MTSKETATDILPDRQPSVRAVAMPSDTNPSGDIFGGWLMSQMDLAAGTAAARRAKGRTATVFVDTMSFLRPVHVGDEVSFFTEIIHTGRTSLRINVEAWRQTRFAETSDKVTEGVFTFVALDDEGRPRPIDPDPQDPVSKALLIVGLAAITPQSAYDNLQPCAPGMAGTQGCDLCKRA